MARRAKPPRPRSSRRAIQMPAVLPVGGTGDSARSFKELDVPPARGFQLDSGPLPGWARWPRLRYQITAPHIGGRLGPTAVAMWARLWRRDFTVLPDLLNADVAQYLREPLVVEALLALRLRCVSEDRTTRTEARRLLEKAWQTIVPIVPRGRSRRIPHAAVNPTHQRLLEAARTAKATGDRPPPILVCTWNLGACDLTHDERVGLWENVQQGGHLPTGEVPRSLTLTHRWYLVGGTAVPSRRGKTSASPTIITITALQQGQPWLLGALEDLEVDPKDDDAFAGRLEPQHEIRSYLVMNQAIVNKLRMMEKRPGHLRSHSKLSPKDWARETTERFFGLGPKSDFLKTPRKTQTRPRRRPPQPRHSH